MRPELQQAIEAENRRTFLRTASLLNPAKAIHVDPTVRAIKERKLPVVVVKQGDYTRAPDPETMFGLWAFIITACGVVGATMIALQVMGVL